MENDIVHPVEEKEKEGLSGVSLIREVVTMGQRVGADLSFWKKLVHNEQLFGEIVALVQKSGEVQVEPKRPERKRVEAPAVIIRPPASLFVCFSIDDWRRCGAIFTEEQLDTMPACPWDQDMLNEPCLFNKGKRVLETHVGFLGFEEIKVEGAASELLSIKKFQKLYPAVREPRFASYTPDSCYADQDFANRISLGFGWHLLLREIVPNPWDESFPAQERMLLDEYEVPTAVAEVAKNLFTYEKTGSYTNSNCYAQTADLDSDGDRVSVGGCDSDGVDVARWLDDSRVGNIGVSASRKFKRNLAT